MTAADEKGSGLVRTPSGDQLRERLRQTLAPFIDPDDDTMPALNRTDGGFIWVAAETVLDELVAVRDSRREALKQAHVALAIQAGREQAALAEFRRILVEWRDRRWAKFGAAPQLYALLDQVAPRRFPVTSHPYQGEGFLHPCTAKGYGTACGEAEHDHLEPS